MAKIIHYNCIEDAYIGSVKILKELNNTLLCYSVGISAHNSYYPNFFEKHVSAIGAYYYNDCMRSMLSSDEYDKEFQFSYYERMTFPINQIKFVNDTFTKYNDSKKLIISTVKPEDDSGKKITPCLVLLIFNNTNHSVTAVFRAHDYGKRAYYNLLAIKKLIERDFYKLNITLINVISVIAYIEDDSYNKLMGVMPDVFS